jgi:hypothetical protein
MADHAPIQAKSRQLHSFYSCPNTDPTVGRFYNNKHCSNFMIREMTFFSFTNMQSVHITTEFESLSGRGVHHYVIKFVSDLRQAGVFLLVLRFPLPIRLTATI